ncbi:MAG: SirB1 family protein [Isosphaeraceae bacterium]
MTKGAKGRGDVVRERSSAYSCKEGIDTHYRKSCRAGGFRVRSPIDESPEFQRILRGDPRADLVRVAMEIARDAYPDLDPEPYLSRIDELATRVRDRCASLDRPKQVLGQINWVLFVEEGFQGNTEAYFDPRNSYLNEVLDRKTGIPISLSILYWRLAERLGLAVSGVNLPAHFMLQVDQNGSPLFVDPFHAGKLLDREGCEKQVSRLVGRRVELTESQLAPCRPREVVTRMLRNLKSIYLQTQDYPSALPVQRRLASLSMGDAAEQRDLGVLYLRVDRPGDAVLSLQAYLDADPASADAEEVRALLRAAHRDAALRN